MRRGTVIAAACLAALLPVLEARGQDTDVHVAAKVAEEQLLGSDGEDAAWRALLPFTREFQARGVVTGSLAESLAAAGVPVAPTYEALQALGSAIGLEHQVHDGDRFTVRWRQTFTVENQPVGIGRVLSLEVTSKAKGTTAIDRFRPLHQPANQPARFWLANGQGIGKAAAPPPIRLPLDAITITSGFGLRADPLDQPQRMPPVIAAPPTEPEAAAPSPPPPRKAEDAREINRAASGFGYGSQLGSVRSVNSEHDQEIDRIMAERRVRAREEAARKAAEQQAEERAAEAHAAEQAAARLRAQPKKPTVLYMHEGLDLLGNIGTPVHAAADGIVTLARPDRGYGTAIHIEHADHMSTIYGHLSRIAPGIGAGTLVKRGDLIGFVGSTGRSTGAHLHFELLVGGKPVNPLPATKDMALDGFDLGRFKKQLAAEKAGRDLDDRLAHAAPPQPTPAAAPSVAESPHTR